MFSTIVATIEATTISPIGTKTVTLSDRQVSVAGSRSTPSFESPSAPTPRMARISAAPSRTLPAVSMLREYPAASPRNRRLGRARRLTVRPRPQDFPARSNEQTLCWARVRECPLTSNGRDDLVRAVPVAVVIERERPRPQHQRAHAQSSPCSRPSTDEKCAQMSCGTSVERRTPQPSSLSHTTTSALTNCDLSTRGSLGGGRASTGASVRECPPNYGANFRRRVSAATRISCSHSVRSISVVLPLCRERNERLQSALKPNEIDVEPLQLVRCLGRGPVLLDDVLSSVQDARP
jgi:hypothetical protein